eukprot:752619-Hanusia_phi.AAC.2
MMRVSVRPRRHQSASFLFLLFPLLLVFLRSHPILPVKDPLVRLQALSCPQQLAALRSLLSMRRARGVAREDDRSYFAGES